LSGGRRGQRGQAAVELALALPLVALLLLAVVQVGLVVRDQVLTVHAAREAVRAAAVGPDAGAPRAAALAGSGLDGDRLTVSVERGGLVRVAVRYQSVTHLPLVGPLLPDVPLLAKAAMRPES
jgi:Flp pilus assembly protein TadG